MPRTTDWKRYLEAGTQFTELRRSQARDLASDLANQGQLARDQVASAVDEIIAMSRRRREELREFVSTEVQRQLAAVGLATQSDIRRLEQKVNAAVKGTAMRPAARTANRRAGARTAKKSAAAKKSRSARKSTAKKVSAARKSTAKKASTARKSTAKTASTARKSTAKTASTARKSTAKKSAGARASTARKSSRARKSTARKAG
jgi:polyhydroxyalkanoate synthesis regulator phasin